MARFVMTCAGVTLGLGYLLAALLRGYVGFVRTRLRLWYWLSVPACIGLSANQWWLLAQHPPISMRIIFGQTMALGVVVTALVRPALIAYKDPWLGDREAA